MNRRINIISLGIFWTVSLGILISIFSFLSFHNYTKAKAASDVSSLVMDRSELFRESIKEPLRFSNIHELNRVVSFFGNTAISWIILKGASGNVLLTQGEVPDIELVEEFLNGQINWKEAVVFVSGSVSDGDIVLGSYKMALRIDPIIDNYQVQRKQIAIVIIGVFLFSMIILGSTFFFLGREISKLNNEILSYSDGKKPFKSFLKEVDQIYRSFRQKSELMKVQERNLIESKRLVEIGSIAAQVSHDIRSPIMALEVALKDASGLSFERRELIQNASDRIKAIAEDLLSKSRRRSHLEEVPLKQVRTVSQINVLPSIEKIVNEKKLSYSWISMEVDLSDSEVPVFADANDFERVLSNLLENAVEAVANLHDGTIRVALRNYSNQCQLSILDNGRGIPSEVLSRIGDEGFSFGKANGNGLGVSYAKKKMQEWGGSLHISSQAGLGTMLTLTFLKPSKDNLFSVVQ